MHINSPILNLISINSFVYDFSEELEKCQYLHSILRYYLNLVQVNQISLVNNNVTIQ